MSLLICGTSSAVGGSNSNALFQGAAGDASNAKFRTDSQKYAARSYFTEFVGDQTQSIAHRARFGPRQVANDNHEKPQKRQALITTKMTDTTARDLPTALITGATGIIGAQLVRLCLAQGMRVVALGRSGRALAALGARFGFKRLTPVQLDLLSPNAGDDLLALFERSACRLDLLINCAGRGLLAPFSSTAFETQQDLMRHNFESPARLTHALIPKLEAVRGNVLNIVSMAGLVPIPNMAMLSASNAAALNWSLALRKELRGQVNVTAFCPGVTRSGPAHRSATVRSFMGRTFFHHDPVDVATKALAASRAGRPVAYVNRCDRLVAGLTQWLPAALVARAVETLMETQPEDRFAALPQGAQSKPT